MAASQQKKENWGTRLGVILAVTGSAVGLGNFLRFPGLAAQYEGGAFMIPYLLALLLLGLPLAWVEWTMGRYGGARGFNSPPGIFQAIWPSRFAPYVGAMSAAVPVIIYMYYIHLEGWCLGYAWHYLVGTEIVTGGKTIMDEPSLAFPFVAVGFLVNFVLIYRGINKGIEWFNNLAMPALVLCAIVILVRVLTLGAPLAGLPERNIINGLGFMWNPNTANQTLWHSLANAQMWVDATGQIFFSLSVGFGLILTYASYVRRDDDIALSALTSAAGNEFCEVVLAGLMVVPAAFIFIGPESLLKTQGSGLRIGFMALPEVFQRMPAGTFFGFLFFFLLFIAALTSSLSMLQPTIAMFEEGLGLNRKASVSLLGFITAMGTAFVGYFSDGLKAMDTFDFWVGSFALYILATIMVVIFGWVLGIPKAREELDRGAEIHVPTIVLYLVKYVSPVYLMVVFCTWVYQQAIRPPNAGAPSRLQQILTDHTIQLSLAFVALVLGLFLFLATQSARRWRRRANQTAEVRP